MSSNQGATGGGQSSLPVVVLVHGESYAWGAGHLMDGALLAAKSRTVVVTLNYRLGILGIRTSLPALVLYHVRTRPFEGDGIYCSAVTARAHFTRRNGSNYWNFPASALYLATLSPVSIYKCEIIRFYGRSRPGKCRFIAIKKRSRSKLAGAAKCRGT